MFKNLTAIFLFPTLFLLFSSSLAFAQENPAKNFSANFDVEYQALEDGRTKVVQKISLTNTTSSVYAKEYSLSLGSTKIDKVVATDSIGKINAIVSKDDETTAIKLTFNDKVVGQGKTLTFNLNYEISDILSKNGLMWEIVIPKLSISADIKDYNLRLLVPQSFGEIHYMSPTPGEVKDGGVRTYRFSREQLEKGGVSAAFGKYQLFDFELKYHLLNPNLFTSVAQISLPPDTESQQIILDSLEPAAAKLGVDLDGNYLATYELKSGQRLDIVARGSIKMVEAHRDLQKFPPMKKEDLKNYLTGNKYWTLDPLIKQKAQDLTKDLEESSTDEKARALYSYVSTALRYDYDRLQLPTIDRLGALGAINNPTSAICMEYTDLFIALARSLGIPAREVNGYAYTQNKNLRPTKIGGRVTSDILHAWPEYYSLEKERWMQIDPTWGSTTGGVDYFSKLDTNHITFVRKGISPDEPVPAGAYKIDPADDKDVTITPSRTLREEAPNLEIKLKEGSYPSGFSSNATLLVKNTGKRAFFNGQVILDSSSAKVISTDQPSLRTVLPQGEVEVLFKVKSSNLLSTEDLTFSGMVRGTDGEKEIKKDFTEAVHLRPFFTLGLLPFFFGFLVLGILIVVFFLFRYELHRPKKPA